jgi:hypothetical protein
MDWSGDVQAADWIGRRLHPFATDVGSLVPQGYPAYARVLHPARRIEANQPVNVRWADLARDTNTALHPTTQFESLASSAKLHIEPPLRGTLDPDELAALIEHLSDHTRQPESCWFAIWDGYGWIQGPPAVAPLQAHPRKQRRLIRPHAEHVAHPKIHIPGRSFLLWQGPIESAAPFCHPPTCQSPNLWWPRDRAWCVASEIDLYSTYVGGSQALIDRILHDPRVEALLANFGDRIGADRPPPEQTR